MKYSWIRSSTGGPSLCGTRVTRAWKEITTVAMLLVVLCLTSCRSKAGHEANRDFFTSGSKEADQRASQRMAQAEQLEGSGEGAGERGKKKVSTLKSEGDNGLTGATNHGLIVEGKQTLFERLGGQAGLEKIVDDFIPRALNDPRVNWSRAGVTRGGFSLHRGKSVAWREDPDSIARLKKHFVEFLALASGGPAVYQGRSMKAVHGNLHVGNPEFDAVIGDLKASLDRLQIPNKEQKELLAIIESTRPEVVTER